MIARCYDPSVLVASISISLRFPRKTSCDRPICVVFSALFCVLPNVSKTMPTNIKFIWKLCNSSTTEDFENENKTFKFVVFSYHTYHVTSSVTAEI